MTRRRAPKADAWLAKNKTGRSVKSFTPESASGWMLGEVGWRRVLFGDGTPGKIAKTEIVAMGMENSEPSGGTTTKNPPSANPPPTGATIKEVLGFRQFIIRRLEKASLEWPLVSLAWNKSRRHKLGLMTKLITAN